MPAPPPDSAAIGELIHTQQLHERNAATHLTAALHLRKQARKLRHKAKERESWAEDEIALAEKSERRRLELCGDAADAADSEVLDPHRAAWAGISGAETPPDLEWAAHTPEDWLRRVLGDERITPKLIVLKQAKAYGYDPSVIVSAYQRLRPTLRNAGMASLWRLPREESENGQASAVPAPQATSCHCGTGNDGPLFNDEQARALLAIGHPDQPIDTDAASEAMSRDDDPPIGIGIETGYVMCPGCSGAGWIGPAICITCRGAGSVLPSDPPIDPTEGVPAGHEVCDICGGFGNTYTTHPTTHTRCRGCNGDGTIPIEPPDDDADPRPTPDTGQQRIQAEAERVKAASEAPQTGYQPSAADDDRLGTLDAAMVAEREQSFAGTAGERPSNMAELLKWLRRQAGYRGLLDHLLAWGRFQHLPVQIGDWPDDIAPAAYEAIMAKLGGVEPAPTTFGHRQSTQPYSDTVREMAATAKGGEA